MAEHITFQGRKIALILDRGTWRLRSRSRHLRVDFGTGTGDLATAKKLARAHLETLAAGGEVMRRRSGATLEDLGRVYRDLPTRANAETKKDNVYILGSIVRDAWGRELPEVRVSELSPKLWRDFQAQALGGTLDLATRRKGNAALNARVRRARSILIQRLRPAYAERGIIIPDGAEVVNWLPEIREKPAIFNDEKFLKWWESQPVASPQWFAAGFARFAGMRKAEIMAMKPHWIVERPDGYVVEMMDRPEEEFLSKTGEIYTSLILRPELAEAVRLLPADSYVVTVPERQRNPSDKSAESMEKARATYRRRWAERELPKLMKQFSGSSKPFHRLRGIYADHLKRVTESAILARQAAIKEASRALGHTDTETTTRHYLSE